MKHLLLATVLLLTPLAASAADATGSLTPPKSGTIKVAFVLSEGATVIDFAGPWEVFANVMLPGHGDDMDASMPFELYTVAPSKEAIHTSGSHHPGMTITPDYSFADAPMPDVVVIGAQSGGPGLSAWLQKVHADHKVIMSVCTGAFKVAKAGLLDGKEATTHHSFYDDFAQEFPKVKLQRSVRYVQADPIIFTAGGLTSGVDLALHVVAEYYGDSVAQTTADYMEYQSTGWKTNQGVAAGPSHVKREEWAGDIAPGAPLLMHVLTKGGIMTATADIPSQDVTGVPVSIAIDIDGNKATLTFAIPGHQAVYVGIANSTSTVLTGNYTQDGATRPLTLVQKSSATDITD